MLVRISRRHLHIKMGRGKHCSAEKRELIRKLISAGKSYREVGRLVECSNKMIRNAIKFLEKPETRGRKRSTLTLLANRLVRQAKKEPFKTATELKMDFNINAIVQTVRSCLQVNGLKACSPRKAPLLSARKHSNLPFEKWKNVLWTDESKILLYGGKGSRAYVRRPPNAEYNPKYTITTIKHGGCSIMIWVCFSYFGEGPIHHITTIMDQHVYVDILDKVMLPYADYEMPFSWVFQQDNDPKHTSKKAKNWFEEYKVNVMEWPAQSPDLNPIENLWADVKEVVAAAKPTTKGSLWNVVKEAWIEIPLKRCQDLVNLMPRRCVAVIANKGHATKY